MLVRNDGPSLVVNTPAKLNLFLEVLGRRPDGYHELETVMVSIGLYDTLRFRVSDTQQTRLRCHCCHSSASLPTGEENLVLRTVKRLRDVTGCDQPVTIDLVKRIPLQAGLGGGSSDAAATLVGLNRFWSLGLTNAQLHELAASLGSDVNFFLDSPRAALCCGRGELIAPILVAGRQHFVVVCPQAGLSTAEVFRQWSPESREIHSSSQAARALARGRLGLDTATLYNALQTPARVLSHDISRVLETLKSETTLPALMSGSGTACFAVCRTARQARYLAGRLRALRLGCVFAVDMRA